MKQLLNTLYVTTDDAYLALEGENVVVMRDMEKIGRFPLHNLENIISFSYKGASPALMGECVSRNVGLCFMRPGGKFLARVSGEVNGNVLLRKKQYAMADSENDSLVIGKNMLLGKLYNSRWLLERFTRDHALSANVTNIKSASLNIKNSIASMTAADNTDSMRGIEGDAAAEYFGVFNNLILNKDNSFNFNGRTKRPPLDNVNAMLSFAYSLLANSCASALESVGLDPYVGFVHALRPGRESLALDLMEEMRPVIADRFVLYCINNRIVTSQMFDKEESGAVLLNDKGRKVFLKTWQERKQEMLNHPFLNEKLQWGLIPFVQALLLARYLRGDLDAYPTFMWK